MNYAFTCIDCESVHFIVRWDQIGHVWMIACEGCGAIYKLIPTGVAEVHMKGIDQS